ncbi:hypothetical protein DLE54_07435 [Psychrobacter sp. YP14]|jgi:hypothetical protein|uniref:CTP synthetase n=3 Tax=Psychrobacter TaxID=497 RepID=A0A844M049_9GAMM|nr:MULTISPECIES: hypothetical protein [Psychrobacter]AWT49358.1 hypothetical protein DLE54_07435 [Psychrobacter sp. YP14]MUG32144.1 hypothetical protein [Psychrobacter sanguinis]UNK04688.1 hypothetical protein MN210_10695 [Psychrobacter sp. PraFG1]
MNWQLLSMIWGMAATVIIGVFMVAALVTGFDDIPHIISTAVVGALVAIPIALIVTKKINRIES